MSTSVKCKLAPTHRHGFWQRGHCWTRGETYWKSRRLFTCWRRDAVHRQLDQLKPESAYYAVRFSCVWTRRRDAVFVDTSRHAHWHYPSLPESTEKFAFSSSNQAEMLLLDSKSPCNVCTTCTEFLLSQARPTMPCISTSNNYYPVRSIDIAVLIC